MFGVEAGGRGNKLGENAASLCFGRPGVLHGSYSFILQDDFGQISSTHSISAGLDYPGVGPEHSFLKKTGRAKYVCVSDKEALKAFFELAELEGIIPALEPAHALAFLKQLKKELEENAVVVVNLSGRGDKDLTHVLNHSK